MSVPSLSPKNQFVSRALGIKFGYTATRWRHHALLKTHSVQIYPVSGIQGRVGELWSPEAPGATAACSLQSVMRNRSLQMAE